MILDLFRLDGKVAIVTGAGRGIGARIATAFAEVGADVAIGARTELQLADVASEIRAAGRRAVMVAGDLATRDGLSALVDRTVAELGRIDIVVNNVGGSMPQPFMTTSEAVFNEALLWNTTTAFNLTQLAVPHLVRAGGGRVINIASVAGAVPDRGFSTYGTAKAAMIALTENLALDLAPKITVNAIAPGSIATSALEGVLKSEALRSEMVRRTPLDRIGTVDDIAAAAVYLASAAGGFVTGRVLRVDGGTNALTLDLGIPDV